MDTYGEYAYIPLTWISCSSQSRQKLTCLEAAAWPGVACSNAQRHPCPEGI